MATKQGTNKQPAGKSKAVGQPVRKHAAKPAGTPKAPARKKKIPYPAEPKQSGRTIAQRTSDWKNGKTGFLLRWAALVPLALVWYVFTFRMAGYSFSALVCLGIMGLLLFYNICYLTRRKYPKSTRVVKAVVSFVLCAGLLVAGVTEAFIIHASLGDPEESCEYMLVLGAKVRPDGPSVSLMDRIRAAAEYMQAHPQVIAVVSGGRGEDEPMTEARCMYEQLVKLGISPDRIWLEEQATSTWENLQFSLNLIQEKTGTRPEKIGLVSSEYHLFRAKLFADACQVEAVGIPAHTSRISQMINHFMREVAGVWHYILLGGQYSD